MSPARQKARRLARLADIRQLDVRIAENRAIAARSQADAALSQVERVRAIIAEAGAARGVSTGAMLAGAAGLRSLLQSALDVAMHDAREKTQLHSRHVQLHARAEARADHVQESLRHNRRLADLGAEDKERDDRPHRRRKDRP